MLGQPVTRRDTSALADLASLTPAAGEQEQANSGWRLNVELERQTRRDDMLRYSSTIMAFALIMLVLNSGAPALADPARFGPGPAIEEFGAIAEVEGATPIDPTTQFRIAFDVSEPADENAVSRRLESAARFINMHVAAGVPADNIQLAIVVHGRAVHDVSTPAEDGAANANAPLIEALIAHGVEIFVCGQSAAYYDVETEDLLPGVEMALSAMTAHALLQQDGYTLNPF